MKRIIAVSMLALVAFSSTASADLWTKIRDSMTKPFDDIGREAQKAVDKLAVNYKASNPHGDFNDCVTIVAAGAAGYGASVSGPFGAAIGAGGGVPLARIGCGKVF